MSSLAGIGPKRQAFLQRGHPLQRREPAIGYASRLAAMAGVEMVKLLQDMRINPRDLGRGDAVAVGKLADLRSLTSEARESLDRYTPWRAVGDHIATLAGNRLLPRSVLSNSMRVCPHCIAEDMEAFAGPRHARPWLRVEWMINHVRVCGRHGSLLIDVVSPHEPHRPFDFLQAVDVFVSPVLDRLRSESVPGPGCGFGDWILTRLDDVRDPSNWLDDVPLHAAIGFCEALGLSALYGAEIAPSSRTTLERARLAEAGYQVAAQGDAAINAALSLMIERRPTKRGCMGQQMAYGYLYACLYRFRSDPSFEKPRAIVREHAFATLPFEPGRTVLGATLEKRRLHNHSSAAQVFLRSGVGLRRLLEAGGGVVPERTTWPRTRVSVPVAEMEAIAEKLGKYLTAKDVADATGFDKKVVDHLAQAGFLPILPVDARPAGGHHRFHQDDVDALMSRLFRDAWIVNAPNDRRMPLAKARNKARGFATTILAMILDGTLQWVGRIGDGRRYEHLLVDIDEVTGIMRARTAKAGLHMTEAQALILGVTRASITRLAKAGLLISTREYRAKSARTVSVLTRESVEAFAAEYVSLGELSKSTRIHALAVVRRLTDAGVVEAIAWDIPMARIYRRRDVAEARVF